MSSIDDRAVGYFGLRRLKERFGEVFSARHGKLLSTRLKLISQAARTRRLDPEVGVGSRVAVRVCDD